MRPLLVVFCFASLVGCGKPYQTPVLKPAHAHLIAPSEKYELELARDTDNTYITGPDRDLVLLGKGDGIHVQFGFLRKQGWVIDTSYEAGRITVDEAGAYYQLNRSERIPLDLTVKTSGGTEDFPLVYYVSYRAPKAIENYRFEPMTGGTLRESEIKFFKQVEDDLHRFYLPFAAGGKKYAVDVAFKVKIRKELNLSPPGGSP
jgi:hypothetical protein